MSFSWELWPEMICPQKPQREQARIAPRSTPPTSSESWTKPRAIEAGKELKQDYEGRFAGMAVAVQEEQAQVDASINSAAPPKKRLLPRGSGSHAGLGVFAARC